MAVSDEIMNYKVLNTYKCREFTCKGSGAMELAKGRRGSSKAEPFKLEQAHFYIHIRLPSKM